MVCLAPALLLLGQIRHLKIMVPFSIIANISLAVSFAITMYYVFNDIRPLDELNFIASWRQMPKFFATVIFAIEGIGTVSSLIRKRFFFFFLIEENLIYETERVIFNV